jgi:hypothetical protein
VEALLVADANHRTPPLPKPMPIWPWLLAPGLMLMLIVGFTAAVLFFVPHDGKRDLQAEPQEAAIVAPEPEPTPAAPADAPAERVTAETQDVPPEAAPAIPLSQAPLVAASRARPAPDPEPAAKASDRTPSLSRTDLKLPKLSDALRITSPGEAATREVPRASPEREALYDAVVQRFILYDIGRLRERKAALDFEALGPDAIRALVRGLNQSATLEASCPVVSISDKLGRLLATCNDPELLAEVHDSIGKGVGPTLHHAYLTALKQACAERLKKSKDMLRPRVPQLVASLKSKDPEARRKAANTLGLAGADAKAAVPALAEALKDSDEEVRGYAASALAAIGAPAAPALVKAVEASADPQVRGLAGLALEAIDPDFRAALSALRQTRAAVPASGATAKSTKEPCYRTIAELVAATGEPSDPAKQALRELALRRGEQALTALTLAAVSDDRELRELGREMLLKYLSGRPNGKSEEEAARRLKLARRALDEGAGGQALDRLRGFIKANPRTRAAEEARQLLAEAQE